MSMLIRDPVEMEKFAKEVEQYCIAMKKVCKELQSGLQTAAPQMRDSVSKKALKRIEQLEKDLSAGLPAVESTAEMLKKSAKPLKQAKHLL